MKNTVSILFGILLLSTLTACGQNQSDQSNTDTTNTEETPQASVQNLDPETAKPMLNDSSVVTIDVRTPGEIQAGFITGADQFIDYNGGQFQEQIAKLDKGKKYLIYCRSGGRSSAAAKMMIQAGFTQVYNLNGGIMGWDGPTQQ